MLVLKVRRVGNSAALTLPKEALHLLRVREGDNLVLSATPDGYRITPYDDGFVKALEAFEETRRKYRNAFRELAK